MTKRRPGRPSQNIIVPHPLKGDEWIQIGKYDRHWPAANRYWILIREGTPRGEALTKVAAEFGVEEESLLIWLRRSRRRGPIGHNENGPNN